MSTRPRRIPEPPPDRLDLLLRSGTDLADRSGRTPAVEEEVLEEDVHDDLERDPPGQDVAGVVDGPVRGRHRDARVPLVSLPGSLRSTELRVGTGAVRGLLVLAVVAVLVLGGRWLWATRVAVATPVERVATAETAGGADEGPAVEGAVGEGGAGDGGSEGAGTAAAAEVSGDSPEETGEAAGEASTHAVQQPHLVVHVAGQVHEPGVVSVPAGSRVVDAVRAAGGLTDAADQSTLNLARQLVDGERVWVGRPGEEPPVAPGPLPGAGPGGGGAGGAGGSVGAGGPAAPLDLNAASQADLEELPGIGPVTAGQILAWREEHGGFSSVDELIEISGIGERTLARLEPLVIVGG